MQYRHIGKGIYSKAEDRPLAARIAIVLSVAAAFTAASFLVDEEAIGTFISATFL